MQNLTGLGWSWQKARTLKHSEPPPIDANWMWIHHKSKDKVGRVELVVNEDFFYREKALLDYLRVQMGLQAEPRYVSDRQKPRLTRSGRSLSSQVLPTGDAAADVVAEAGPGAAGARKRSTSSAANKQQQRQPDEPSAKKSKLPGFAGKQQASSSSAASSHSASPSSGNNVRDEDVKPRTVTKRSPNAQK